MASTYAVPYEDVLVVYEGLVGTEVPGKTTAARQLNFYVTVRDAVLEASRGYDLD